MKRWFLLSACIYSTAMAGQPVYSFADGGSHILQAQFVSRIETNTPAPLGLVMNGYYITNSFRFSAYYDEKPFPRTSNTEEVFDVVSNTYCNIIIDGKATNTITTSSTKLGTLKRRSSTIITTQTNCVNSEVFSPDK